MLPICEDVWDKTFEAEGNFSNPHTIVHVMNIVQHVCAHAWSWNYIWWLPKPLKMFIKYVLSNLENFHIWPETWFYDVPEATVQIRL